MKKILLLIFTVVSSFIVSAQCDYTLRMIDSYGDGWNGNTMDVLVNGAVVLDDVTLASGSSEDVAITVNTGDEITTLWNADGSWGEETSYQILDVSGNEVGAGAQTSIETAITVNCPSCNVVSAIDASNISTSGGDISWTAGGSESAWNIEYGTSGFALGSGSSATSTNPSYSISGLNGGTLYDVYVQADCGSGETSDWAGPYSFSTLGSCGGYTLTLVDTYGDGWNGGVINVSINSTAVGSYTIVSGGGPEVYTIQTNIGDVIEFVYTAGSYSGENEYTVTNELGEVLAEEGQGGGTPGSVTFTACASCPDISLAALTVNAESAVASWNPEDEFTSYTLEIGDTGFVLGTGTTYTTSDTSYTFTGLSENTYYSFYLSPTCGADVGTAQGPYNFQTFCNTITTGWSEDWSDLSGCIWNTYNSNGDGYGWILTTNGDYGINNYSATSANDYLMSPVFTCSDGISDRIRFDAKNIYVQYGDQYRDTLTVGLYDAGVTTLVGVLGSIVPETDYTTFEYDLSLYEGQDVRFFVYSGVSSGANLNGISYIDNVIADAFPSCDAPSDLIAENTTESTTDLTWTELGTATSWNIEYGLSGFVQGNGTIETSSSTSYTLTNLESASTYDVYVQSDCGSGEVSDWIGPVTFSTPGTCGFITVELVDDYGDGWNGNSLEVVVNSITVGTFTVSSGASASYVIPINTGDIIDLNYLNTGTWGGENGWNIYDQDGNLILEVPATGNGGQTGAGPENTVGFEACPIPCDPNINNISETACDSFTWVDGDGNTYTESGTYTITETAANGCDSVVNLTLIINESSSSLISEIECDSYEWNGNNYNESGIYTFETTNIQNCPNIDSLDLTINLSTSSLEEVSSCESYEWNGITYNQSDEYTITNLTNNVGCDSTATLDLTINTSNSSFEEVSSCESYDWNGTTYNDVGTNSYTFNTVTVNGCDSIAELLLTINVSTSSFEQASSCVTYDWNGTTYTESGLYTFESTNDAGCSNIDSLNLTITNVGTTSDVTACDSYDWNGVTYSNSGNYENDNGGCIDILNLTINVSTSSFEQASSCGSYEWNGTLYSQSGTYTTPTTTNQVGCDSTSTLELTINEAVENNITETVCDELEWNGVTYTESGNYSYQGTTSNGCDSIVNLTLTVNVSTSSLDQASSCDTYVWNGDTLSISGIYVVQSTNNAGCPNVDSLNLNIDNSITESVTESACDSYEWDGSTYTVSGEYTFFGETANGCDSTVTLLLTVNYTTDSSLTITECSSYNFNGESLTISGDYSDTIQSSTGCDSIVNLSLTILGPDSVEVNVVECEADTYEWDGETYSSSGSYSNNYQNINGCDSIATLVLTLSDPYAGEFLEELDETRANFAAPTNLPGCWNLENSGLSTWANSGGGITVLGLNGYVSGPSSGADGEGEYLYVQTYNFDAGSFASHNDSSMITTKDVDLSSLSNPELYFNYQLHGVDMGHLSVWINDGSGLTEIFSESGQMGNLWYEASIDLSSYSGTVSFSILSVLDSTSTDAIVNSEMAIDNFGVREQLSCYDPYNLLVEGIDGSTATVSWMTHPSITSWNYVFGDPGIDPDSASVMTTTSSTLEIEDLAFASQYEMYVQSDCGTEWVGPLVINVPFPEDYGCTHTLNMFDSYGDGWNGGSIDILINGATAVAAGTIVTGAEESIEFGAEDGDDITITNFVPGSWSGEISFNITDGSGSVIYSSGEAGDLDASSVIDTTVSGNCPENDLVAIAGAVPSGCDLSTEEVLEIWVFNAGVGAETGFTVSYSVNGGTEVIEEITDTINSGDTLMHMFATTADMSAAGEYDVTMACSLSTDILNSNDTVYASGTNTASPEAPNTVGDTVCSGDTSNLMAMSSENIVWYDSENNVVGLGESLMTMDTATTSYFAQAAISEGFSDDFESYTAGDFIAQSNTEHWATWPGGELGGQYDAPVSADQAASGSNSLHLDNAEPNVPDPVMIFGGQTWNSGSFEFSMNMYVATTAYFNLQGSANIGTIWAMQMTFDNQGGYDFGDGAIAGLYPGTGQWFNISLKCNDLTTSIWELFIDGESQGSVDLPNGSSVGGCNFYAAEGNDYYVDDVSWTAISSDACRSDLVEVVNTVEECVGINELNYNRVSIYPNPSNGEFMVTNNVDITTISITDAQGKVVHSLNNLNLSKVNIDITDLEKGMYLINIETVNGTTTKPVMVK